MKNESNTYYYALTIPEINQSYIELGKLTEDELLDNISSSLINLIFISEDIECVRRHILSLYPEYTVNNNKPKSSNVIEVYTKQPLKFSIREYIKNTDTNAEILTFSLVCFILAIYIILGICAYMS